MGRIVTPKYRVEYRDNLLAMGKTRPDGVGADGRSCHMQCWKGRVSVERLEDWRKDMNRSFNVGGSNYHIATAFNAIPHIYTAKIVRQSDGRVMCKTDMPVFEVA